MTTTSVEGNRTIIASRPPNPYQSEAQSGLNRAVQGIGLKSVLHWAHPWFFHRYAIFNWTPPYSYQLPGRFYKANKISQNTLGEIEVDTDLDQDEIKERERDRLAESKAKQDHLKYLDVFRRKTRGKIEDRCLNPTDGQLGILVVQSTSAVYNERNRTTWRRTYIENISSYIVRLAYWPTAGIERSFDDWQREDWLYAGLRWLPSCIGLLIVVRFELSMCMTQLRIFLQMICPTDAEGQVRNNGYYDPFPYRFWSYPKTSRNHYENRPQESSVAYIPDRIIRPRKLCFLDAVTKANPNGLLPEDQWKVSEPTYLFVSYTGVAFRRPCGKGGDCRCKCSYPELRFLSSPIHLLIFSMKPRRNMFNLNCGCEGTPQDGQGCSKRRVSTCILDGPMLHERNSRGERQRSLPHQRRSP
jgi:hypothetical protein